MEEANKERHGGTTKAKSSMKCYSVVVVYLS